jgi:hypothetical protein
MVMGEVTAVSVSAKIGPVHLSRDAYVPETLVCMCASRH